MRHLNDNVFQNVHNKFIGTRNYQQEESKKQTKLKKDPLLVDKKEDITDEFLKQTI